MSWTGTAQQALDAGDPVILSSLVCLKPRRRADNVVVVEGFWSGFEPLTLVVEGEVRTYQPTGAALDPGESVTAEGLEVGSQTPSLAGLGPISERLRRDYDLSQAAADGHLLLETPGLQVLGVLRLFSGAIDRDPLEIAANAGSLALDVIDRLRVGTRSIAATKSEDRDPAFRYVHLDAGDSWG